MPRIRIKDKEGRTWKAVEHGAAHVEIGPMHRDAKRSAIVHFDIGELDCFLGAEWNGTRVSFQHPAYGGTWWHITKGNQAKSQDGRKPNFYPIVEALI